MENDFADVPVQVRGQQPATNHMNAVPTARTSAGITDQTRAIAEVHAAMMIARMNPRNILDVHDRVANACQRPRLAATALYQYARGGSDISGESIRLAEMLANEMTNIHYGWRELEQRPGVSVAQAYAWDTETNTRSEITFEVTHVRHTKNGSYKLTDPRDIYEMVANQASRRVRSCILRIIPGDIKELAVVECEKTLKATADTSAEGVKKLLEAFAEFDVTKEMIEKRIQRRIDAITAANVVSLRKIFHSLRDGMSSPEEWFEVPVAVKPAAESSADKPAPATTNGKARPAAPKLTDEQGDQVNRISEILTSLAGGNTAEHKRLLTNWSDATVASLTSLPQHPDLIPTVLDRAEITLREAEEAKATASQAQKKGKLL